MQRKNYFNHQAAAFSYEGRTRGKRIRYNYSDDDEGASAGGTSDGASIRRSERASRAASNAPEGPRFTASGRQVKRPTDGRYGGIAASGSYGTSTGAVTPASVGSENGDLSLRPSKRSRRTGGQYANYLDGSAESEDSYDSRAEAEEDEYRDNGEETDEDEMSVDDAVPEEDPIRGSLVIALKYNVGGRVAAYLNTKDSRESPPRAFPADGTVTGSTIGNMTDTLTGLGDMGDSGKKELRVIESRPMNGTAVAEIRSKGPEAG